MILRVQNDDSYTKLPLTVSPFHDHIHRLIAHSKKMERWRMNCPLCSGEILDRGSRGYQCPACGNFWSLFNGRLVFRGSR
jgi:hypothetical protein